MKKIAFLSLTAVVAGLAAASPVSALVIEQSQSQSQSSSSNSSSSVTVTNGSGSGSANSEAKNSQSQAQYQKVDTGATYNYGTVGRARTNRGVVRGAWISANTDGQVRLNWAQRGGTCHIRYSENTDRGYKYATSAGCNDGGLTIGGLTPGVVYRFQMKQDNGAWSKAIIVKAQ